MAQVGAGATVKEFSKLVQYSQSNHWFRGPVNLALSPLLCCNSAGKSGSKTWYRKTPKVGRVIFGPPCNSWSACPLSLRPGVSLSLQPGDKIGEIWTYLFSFFSCWSKIYIVLRGNIWNISTKIVYITIVCLLSVDFTIFWPHNKDSRIQIKDSLCQEKFQGFMYCTLKFMDSFFLIHIY